MKWSSLTSWKHQQVLQICFRIVWAWVKNRRFRFHIAMVHRFIGYKHKKTPCGAAFLDFWLHLRGLWPMTHQRWRGVLLQMLWRFQRWGMSCNKMLLLGGYLPATYTYSFLFNGRQGMIWFDLACNREKKHTMKFAHLSLWRTGARVNAMVKEWGGVGMFESNHRYNRCINVFNYICIFKYTYT